MRLSRRITAITGEGGDGWGVFYRARRMKAAGERVLDLTIGEHDQPTDPRIIERMAQAARAGNTGYAPVPGSASLRAAIAEKVHAQTGVPTTAENVIVTTGGQAALFAAHLALLDEGDTGLYLDPYYATYPGGIRALGARAVPVPTRSGDGFLPRREILEPLARGARSLLVNTPNNPTGAVYPRQTLEMIAEVVRAHGLGLVSDEVYASQVWEGEHVSPRALPGMADHCLVVGSMSKSHAMTGFRLGWVIGPEAAVARILDLATVNAYGVPGFIQDAAEWALREGGAIEREVAEVFARRRALAQAALEGCRSVRLIPPQGAMYVMLDIRATGLSGEQFANRLLDEARIAVMPGESFGASAAGHIRVALTIEDRALAEALERIAGLAEQLAHQREHIA